MQSLTSTQQQELLKTLLKLQSDLIEQLEIGEAATAVVKFGRSGVENGCPAAAEHGNLNQTKSRD